MDFSWLSALFGAFGIGLLKLLWDMIKYFVQRRDKKSYAEKKFRNRQVQIETLFNDLLSGSVRIQELIEEFQRIHDVDRIVILRMENGGGIPQLGTAQHISVLYETYNEYTVDPIKSDFQNYTIDASYQKMLMEIINNEQLQLKVDEMEVGMLKKVYTAHGIQQAILAKISHIPSLGETKSKGFMVYMSIQIKDNRELNAKIESDIAILQDKIAQVFHTFYMKRVTLFD